MTREIPIAGGRIVLCDDADHEWLSRYTWLFRAATDGKGGYARREVKPGPGKQKAYVRMHREIVGAKAGESVDHIDHNGLNNQRANLRKCTYAENAHNQGPRKGTSIYKGVYFDKDRNLWAAKIGLNRKAYDLGRFAKEIDAAKAYDAASLKYHGSFGYRNFPLEQNQTTDALNISRS